MRVQIDDLQLCGDCLMAAVNGDGPEDTARAAAVDAGLERLGPNLVPDFDSETDDGILEFSHAQCVCCLTLLAGGRYRFAVLGPDEEERSGYRDCACRDCFELIVGTPGAFCAGCIEAGCPDYQGVQGMSQECRREDAYGVDETEE